MVGEIDGGAVHRDLVPVLVEHDLVRRGFLLRPGRDVLLPRDADALRLHLRRSRGLRALKRDADPGEQFLDRERLGDVVVGAGVEAGHLIHHRIPRRQQDDRNALLLAEAPQHLYAV